MGIMVENVKRTRNGEVIMRGTPLGNPFALGRTYSRTESIAKYKRWLWGQMQADEPNPVQRELARLLEILERTGHLTLLCCCKPLACHGDVVKSAIEWMKGRGS